VVQEQRVSLPGAVVSKGLAIALNTEKSNAENTRINELVHEPGLPAEVLHILSLGEVGRDEHGGHPHSADETEQRHLHVAGERAGVERRIFHVDLGRGDVEAVDVVAVAEVVDKVASHGVLAIVDGAFVGAFAGPSEISFESGSAGVED